MTKVWIVQGEHPFNNFYPLEVYASEEGAAKRAVDLTFEFLTEYWAIKHDDDGETAMPHVTVENWTDIVDEYGSDEEFVQNDSWGEWFVGVREEEVRNA